MRDFHIYVQQDAGGTVLSAVLDPKDPQKREILTAMSEAFNRVGRSREADECLHAMTWRAD